MKEKIDINDMLRNKVVEKITIYIVNKYQNNQNFSWKQLRRFSISFFKHNNRDKDR